MLSAIRLKQWRVPRTLNFACCLTNDLISWGELTVESLCVLYCRLPAQFLSAVSGKPAPIRDTTGLAIIAEQSLMNLRLSMPVNERVYCTWVRFET